MSEFINFSKKIPLRYQADVVVIGGGMAGVCAACAAMREGSSVILVEHFAVTGGNATSGGVAAFCGESAGQGAIFDEIVADLEGFNAIANYEPYPSKARIFNHKILAVTLQEMLLRYGVKLLLHTQFIDLNIKNNSINEILVCGPSGVEAISVKQVVDATGEAHVVNAAGFDTMKGRDKDGLQLPMSMMFFVRHMQEKEELYMMPESFMEEPIQNSNDLPMTSEWPNGPRSSAIKIKVPFGDSTDTESMTAVEIRARQKMMKVIDFYQKSYGTKWMLEYCSPIIGIREGRRAVGDYILTVDDLRKGCKFDDAIARGVFFLDGHKPDDDKRTYILSKQELKVPPYQIPLRSIRVKDADNLMSAGRCFSADQLALSSARTMTTASMLGQAAGINAAFAAKGNCDIRKIDPLEIRKCVEKNGAKLAVN